MRNNNKRILVLFQDREKASEVERILEKKFPQEKNNLIETVSTIPEALDFFDNYYYDLKTFDVILLYLGDPHSTRTEFHSLMNAKQTGHEWIIIGDGSKLKKKDEVSIEKYKMTFLPLLEEKALISILEHIFEKEFNKKKYSLINLIDELIDLRKDTSTTKELLSKIVDITLNFLGFKICWVSIVNHEENKLEIGALTGFGELEQEYRDTFNISLDEETPTTICVKKRMQIHYEDVLAPSCPFKYKDLAKKVGLKSILLTPIFVSDSTGSKKVFATLNLYTDFPHKFREDELELAQLIAFKASKVLSIKGLYEEEQDETRKKLALIEKVAAEINKNVRDYRKVFETIVNESLKLLNATRGCIKICHDNYICREYATGYKDEGRKNEKYRYLGITNHVIKTKKSLLIDDLSNSKYKDPTIKYGGINSRISVPLMLQEKVIGVLTVEHKEREYFNNGHLQLFEALAPHAVIAIENTKQYKKLQRQLKSQLVIKKLIEETSKLEAIDNENVRNKYRQEQLDTIIEDVVKDTGKIFEANSGYIALAKLTSTTFTISQRWQFGLKTDHIPRYEIGTLDKKGKVSFQHTPSLTGKVIADGNLQNCTRVEEEPLYLKYSPYDATKSLIVLPLKFQSQTFGAFALTSEEEFGFSEDDGEILESIAIQIALLIKRFDYLNSLLDLNKPFKMLHDLDQIYDEILTRTLKVMKTKVGYIRVLEKNKLVIKGSKGLEDEGTSGLVLKVGEGIAGKVAKNLRPIRVANIQAAGSKYKYKDFAESNNLYAMISIPIINEDKKGKRSLTGLINTYANRIWDFTSLDLQLMLVIAEKASEAINKARLISQLNAVASVDKFLATQTEETVIQRIADTAQTLLDADSVVLYRYNASKTENMGFIVPATVAGRFRYSDFKSQSKFTENSVVVKLLGKKTDAFFIESYKNDKGIQSLIKYRTNNNLQVPFYQREGLKSAIILKLKYQREFVGILFINYRYPKSFSPYEKKIAKIFANKAAIATNNIRKYEDIDRLHEIGNVISTESDLGKVLNRIVFDAAKALNADITIVYRYDQNAKKVIEPPISYGEIYAPQQMEGEGSQNNLVLSLTEKKKDVFAIDVRKNRLFRSSEPEGGVTRLSRFSEVENIESCAAVLLRVRREILGVMFINYRRKQRFASQQRRIIKIFANQASIAIRNANLLEESKQNVKRTESNLNAIQDSGNQIVKNLNKSKLYEKDVLNPILKKALNLLHVDMGYISIVDKDKKCAKIQVSSSQYLALQNEPINIYYPNKTWVKRRKRFSIYNEGDKNEEGYIKFSNMPHILGKYPELTFTGDQDIKSALRVPIYAAEEVLGMIVLESKKENAFSTIDAYTVVSLANQASMALKNAKYIRQLKKLRDIDTVILKNQGNLDTVLNVILRVTLELVKKKYADIKLLRENNLVIKKSIPPEAENNIISIENSISGIAVETMRMFYEKDVSKNDRFLRTKGINTRSELAIPLLKDEELIGVLNIKSEEIDDFTKEEIDMLEILAGQAAIAIVNAKNYDDVQMAKISLQNSVHKKILEGFTQMNSVFEHQISNSVGLIRLDAIELLEKKDEQKFSQETIENLVLIQKRAETALKAPNEATVKANKMLFAEKQNINIANLLKAIAKETIIAIDYSNQINLTISCPKNLPFVEANYDLIYNGVFLELILNGIKAIPGRGEIKIEVKKIDGTSTQTDLKWKNTSYLEFSVSDTGCGVPDGREEEIFEPKTSFWETRRGSGNGLFYLKSIIISLGGDVYCRNLKSKGTTFVIHLPISKG